MMRTAAGLSVLFALALSLLAGTHGVAAQEASPWSDPALLGADLPASWFPEIHADGSGNVFAVWETTFPQGDADPHSWSASGSAIMLAVYGLAGWSEPADIFVKDVFNAARPIVYSDGRYLHIVFRHSPAQTGLQTLSGMYHMRAPLSADVLDATSWSEPKRLSVNAAYWAQIAGLPDGVLVVTYNDAIEETINGQIVRRAALFSRRSDDYGATWEPPVSISPGRWPVARSSLTAAPGTDSFIVAWDDGYDNLSAKGSPVGYGTAVSTDAGRTWGHFVDVSGFTEQATVASNGTTALLVYRSTVAERLYFRASADGGRTWSDELAIAEATPRVYNNKHHFDRLSLTVDGSGRFLLGYVGPFGDAEDALAVFVATFDGLAWNRPVIAARVDGFPEYPRLTVRGGNQLFLIFFVRDALFGGEGQNAIWTAGRTSDAQPVEPLRVELPPAPQVEAVPNIGQVAFDPHPTPPPAPEPSSSLDSPTVSPQAALTRPVLTALALTFGLVALSVMAVGAVRAMLNLGG